MSIPDVVSFFWVGFQFEGLPYLTCGLNMLVTLPYPPDQVVIRETGLTCPGEDDEPMPVCLYITPLDTRVSVQTTEVKYLSEMVPEGLQTKHPLLRKPPLQVPKIDLRRELEKALEGARKDIEAIITECGADPSCVFYKTFDLMKERICGDAYKKNCGPYDLACKLEKEACNLCRGTIDGFKDIVRAFLCANYAICF